MLEDERLFFHPKSIGRSIIGSFISQSFSLKGLLNEWKENGFSVSMSSHNKHHSKLRIIPIFVDASMHDSYDINISKYSKVSGIQRTAQLYYVMEGKNYYILGIILVANSVRRVHGQERRWGSRHLCLSKIKGMVLYMDPLFYIGEIFSHIHFTSVYLVY